jgi:hypothetical protein
VKEKKVSINKIDGMFESLVHSTDSLRKALLFGASERQSEQSIIWCFAIYRRFTLSYFVFINFLIVRVNKSSKKPEHINIEDICDQAIKEGLLTASDKETVMEFSMIYATLQYYDEEYDTDDIEILKDIPAKYEFLENFIVRHSHVKKDSLTEAAL